MMEQHYGMPPDGKWCKCGLSAGHKLTNLMGGEVVARPPKAIYDEGGICRVCGGMTQRTGTCRTCTECGASDGCG